MKKSLFLIAVMLMTSMTSCSGVKMISPERKVAENVDTSKLYNQSFLQKINAAKEKNSDSKSSIQNSADNASKNISGAADNTSSDVSASNNSSTSAISQPSHKYGNASQDDGGMMRGTPAQNPKSNSSDNTSAASNDGDAEANAITANIFVNTTSGDAPLTVNFINQGAASSLSWDFGDGTSSREIAPAHTFDKAGNYEVTLTAKNSSGSASAKVMIEVKPISLIGTIPNVFTPNGDGENDVFHFELKNIESIGVAIYSREAGIVYTWNSLDGNWNGKLLNGNDAPKGVYFYSVQAIGTDGVSHSQNGSVTLSR